MKNIIYLVLVGAFVISQQGCKENTIKSNENICNYDGGKSVCGELYLYWHDGYKDNDTSDLKDLIDKHGGIIIHEIIQLSLIIAKFETNDLPTIKSMFEDKDYVDNVNYNSIVVPD